LVEWYYPEGDQVTNGRPLCSIETSKAILDIESPADGYLFHLVAEKEIARINEPVALIGVDLKMLQSARDDYKIQASSETAQSGSIDGEFKATAKAVALAEQTGIDLSDIKAGGIIKEKDVREFMQLSEAATSVSVEQLIPHEDFISVVIYGAGKGGITVKECLELGEKYRAICFIDDNPGNINSLCGLPVFHASQLKEIAEKGIKHLFCAIANGVLRMKIMKICQGTGIEMINAIHPHSYIAPSVKIGTGNHIKAGSVIDTNTAIGDCCIIDNGAVLAHDNQIGNGCHLAPGVSMGSGIRLGEFTVIGIGASVSTGLEIGRMSIIAVGSSVVKNVPDNSVVEGVPGKITGRRKQE
jgi:UDP-perosamine 4-acetyltransferase